MSAMAQVGDSLREDERHEKMLRRTHGSGSCPRCREPRSPRGYDIQTGLCWFCTFPIRTAAK